MVLSIEEEIIKVLKNPESPRQINFLAMGLILNSFNIDHLADLAKKNDVQNKLGFLSDICAVASQNMPSYKKLDELSKKLSNDYKKWVFLEPTLPEYAKRIIKGNKKNEYNSKWMVYSSLTPEEIRDRISLYL